MVVPLMFLKKLYNEFCSDFESFHFISTVYGLFFPNSSQWLMWFVLFTVVILNGALWLWLAPVRMSLSSWHIPFICFFVSPSKPTWPIEIIVFPVPFLETIRSCSSFFPHLDSKFEWPSSGVISTLCFSQQWIYLFLTMKTAVRHTPRQGKESKSSMYHSVKTLFLVSMVVNHLSFKHLQLLC